MNNAMWIDRAVDEKQNPEIVLHLSESDYLIIKTVMRAQLPMLIKAAEVRLSFWLAALNFDKAEASNRELNRLKNQYQLFKK